MRRTPCAVNRVVGLVDVRQRSIAQAAGFRNIFRMFEIVMRGRQQLIGAGEAVAPAGVHIDGPVVPGILPVIDCRVLDLANRRIDLLNCVFVVSPHRVPIPTAFIQVGARHAQIAQRVKVSRMRTRHLRLGSPGKQSHSACE